MFNVGDILIADDNYEGRLTGLIIGIDVAIHRDDTKVPFVTIMWSHDVYETSLDRTRLSVIEWQVNNAQEPWKHIKVSEHA